MALPAGLRLTIGSDHGGYQLKEFLKGMLTTSGAIVIDRGNYGPDPVDYPDIATLVCSDIREGRADLGVLVCGTGIGMSNAANKVTGIVAALCFNEYMARMARMHNDANVLCLGGRVIGDETAWAVLESFLLARPLMDEKYLRRRRKVGEIG